MEKAHLEAVHTDAQKAEEFNPNSEVEVGGTGDSPVPSGHWPDGTGKTFALAGDVRKILSAFPIPGGGSPPGTGQWHVLPTKMATATSEFGSKAFVLSYRIIYADPVDLTKMLDMSPGTYELDGVGENLRLFYP
jgi:hypothetical protein